MDTSITSKSVRRYLTFAAIVLVWGSFTQGFLAAILAAFIGVVLVRQLVALYRARLLVGGPSLVSIVWLFGEYVLFSLGVCWLFGNDVMYKSIRVYGPFWDTLSAMSWGQVFGVAVIVGVGLGIYGGLSKRN